MWQRFLIDPLAGRTPLWKVIWIYGFGVSIVFLVVEPLFTGSRLAHALYYALGIIVAILQTVMLWQCAFNSRARAYGYVVRFLAVLGALTIPLAAYLILSHPELMQLLEQVTAPDAPR